MKLRKSLEDIKHLVKDIPYPSQLPDDLIDHHYYIADNGHSIMCVLKTHLDEASKSNMDGYEIAVPVKYVLDNGYTHMGDYVIVEAEYSLNYVYGKFAKSELGLNTDVDGDILENDLLYAYTDHNKNIDEMTMYKVSEEDIEDLEKYFVVDSKFDNKEKTNLTQEWTTLCKNEKEAIEEALEQWKSLTDKEKESRTIVVGYGTFANYDVVKELS